MKINVSNLLQGKNGKMVLHAENAGIQTIAKEENHFQGVVQDVKPRNLPLHTQYFTDAGFQLLKRLKLPIWFATHLRFPPMKFQGNWTEGR